MGKTNRTTNCPYCHKELKAQGLGGHVFAIHGIRLVQQELHDFSRCKKFIK